MAVATPLNKSWSLDSQLFLAIQNHDVNKALYLFQQGVDTDLRFARNSLKRSALSLSVENNDHAMVELLIQRGANVNTFDSSGQNPLHIACEYGFSSIVRVLLDSSSNPNTKNKHGQTPLHLAAMRGNRDLCSLLLDYGASLSMRDSIRRTPLHYAASLDNSETVAFLLEAGDDASVVDKFGNSPLHYACSQGTSVEIIKALSHGYPKAILLFNREQRTPLHFIVPHKKWELILALEFMLTLAPVQLASASTCLSLKTDRGHTPLHLAVLERNAEAARRLISFGSEVDTRDQLGRTPIECAARDGSVVMVKLLLAAGASIRRLCCEGKVIHWVHDPEIREILQEAISNPPKLSSICRSTISRYFGPRLIELMPLMPGRWQSFLTFDSL